MTKEIGELVRMIPNNVIVLLYFRMGARCYWDSDTDNYAQDIFMNVSINKYRFEINQSINNNVGLHYDNFATFSRLIIHNALSSFY